MDEFNMDDFQSDLERVKALQSIVADKATGGSPNEAGYRELRRYFLARPDTKGIVPGFIRTSQNLSQFWQFIKLEVSGYEERRDFIKAEFAPLVEYLGKGQTEKGEISDANKGAYEQAVGRIEEAAKDGRRELKLVGMGLAKLPGEIENLTSLTRLDLSHNQLTELPGEIENLTSLRRFDLSYNQLTELPEVIGTLTNLTELHLQNNRLTKLPEVIGNLTSLVLCKN